MGLLLVGAEGLGGIVRGPFLLAVEVGRAFRLMEEEVEAVLGEVVGHVRGRREGEGACQGGTRASETYLH